MKIRLGVWSRLGVVLTFVWLIVGTAYFFFREVNSWSAGTSALYSLCMSDARDVATADRCQAEMAASFQRLGAAQLEFFWGSLAAAAIWAAIGWIVGLFVYWATRWILAGRRPRA